jgi:DNA-binding LacI/PurR family transcriptional regulator
LDDPENRRAGFVSAQQVAERAGVSRSAVSRAFTPGASVATETREKIMQAASELGYQVNDLARGLLANQSRLVGLVVKGPEVGWRAALTAALAKALIRRGSVPILINTGETDAEMLAAQQTLFGYRAEATMVLNGTPPASFVELARRNGQPLIVLGRSEPEADHVRADNDTPSREAARLFVQAGAKVLGLAGSDSATPSVTEREEGFRAEAAALGVEVIWHRGGDSNYRGGLRAAERMFAGPVRPDAVFCINDQIALGVLDHIRHRAGLRVPEDVKVIGFDDVPEAGWLSYGLTTYRQDPVEMAEEAVDVLDLRQAEPHRPPQRRRLTAHLIVRQSFTPGT